MSETIPETRRVLLARPGYGQTTEESARGAWCASKKSAAAIPLEVNVMGSRGSLLAQNFNACWCIALNECLRGHRIDYFAMLHADVEPQDYWLDMLVEELEAKNLDVLSAVIPIKDAKGLTSIALERPVPDTWRPLCRLTLREIYQLPETFTSDDVCGYRLLLNTGCWVCRFDPSWAARIFFTINDRIVFNTKLNGYQAQTEPEDWNFSRQCRAWNLKIGATRKVSIKHGGDAHWPNHAEWGQWTFDEQYVESSVITPALLRKSFDEQHKPKPLAVVNPPSPILENSHGL